MAHLVPPLSAREHRPLRIAGSAQVAAFLTPRPTNPLLVKDDVGRAKPSCYDLPDERFAYGRPGNLDHEGAREVSMQWMLHTPSPLPEGNFPDFIGWNKRAAGAKITTSKDVKHFRKEQDLRCSQLAAPAPAERMAPSKPWPEGPPERPAKAARDIIPSDVIPGFAYGRKVRPSTPIGDVITGRFAARSEFTLQQMYAEDQQLREAAQYQVRRIPLTAASRGHATAAKKALMKQEDPKELFKLSKFKRVGPKVVNRERRPLLGQQLEDALSRDDDGNSTVFSDTAPGLLVDERRPTPAGQAPAM